MRLVVVSNRLPFTVSIVEGKPHFRESSGGLVTGLWSYLERRNSNAREPLEYLWVGWPGAPIPPEHQAQVREHGQARFKAWPVFLTEESIDRFYFGFSNKTLWPLFHYFPSFVRYEEEYWNEYKQVNLAFRDALVEFLRPDDLVWVHDFQLMLLPRLLRERFPEMAIGYFHHIPFPSFEIFRLLPAAWRAEIVEGLLGSSLIGFHTHDYTRHFLGCVLRTVGHEHQLGFITLRDRLVKVDTFPMGIEFEKFSRAALSAETEQELAKLRRRFSGKKVIFSVDRLDYTKGIVNRLKAYAYFLKHNPQWHDRVTLILSVAPSRTGVETYQAMKQEIEQLVSQIVGTYGHMHWTPIIYQYRTLGFAQLMPLYRLCDVALVTPLRDGMNLVAKEFVASRPDQTGVLILSEMAGAAKEMGEALVINPTYYPEMAQAIEQALAMPPEEQIRRNQIMQERLRRYDVTRWAEDFSQALLATRQTQAAAQSRWLSGKAQTGLIRDYRSATRRALLLDYDGTLVPFADTPKQAVPDNELLEMLSGLAADPANALAIVSGRMRSDLDGWFGHLPITLVAEHGVWLKPAGAEWRQLRTLTKAWKEQVRPILQLYIDHLPGAQLEEKEFSLALHYRQADPEHAFLRTKELLDDLADYTRNIDIQVLEGNKVIEVRNTGVTKGTGALEWLKNYAADFVLAIGDDWTDEDLFRALPPTAYSVRVGLANTAARFHLATHTAVRRILRDLVENSSLTNSLNR